MRFFHEIKILDKYTILPIFIKLFNIIMVYILKIFFFSNISKLFKILVSHICFWSYAKLTKRLSSVICSLVIHAAMKLVCVKITESIYRKKKKELYGEHMSKRVDFCLLAKIYDLTFK